MADPVQQAITLIEAGRLEQAHSVLMSVLKADPKNDAAWYWMSKVVAGDELREQCLREAVKINPKNTLALKALDEMEDRQSQAAAAKPIDKWEPLEKVAPQPKTRSATIRPYSRPDTIPIAICLFVIALILAAVTYFFTREDLTYRSEGLVMSATVTKLNRTPGGAEQPEQCAAEYQFLAYGEVRKGTLPVPCTEVDRLDDVRQIKIQYLSSRPNVNRLYPPAQTTERYAVTGFGLAVLLVIVGIVLIVWHFWPQKPPQ